MSAYLHQQRNCSALAYSTNNRQNCGILWPVSINFFNLFTMNHTMLIPGPYNYVLFP